MCPVDECVAIRIYLSLYFSYSYVQLYVKYNACVGEVYSSLQLHISSIHLFASGKTEKLDRRQTEKNSAKSNSATNNLTTIKNTHKNAIISSKCQEP